MGILIPCVVIGLATAAAEPSKEQKIEEIAEFLGNYYRASAPEKAEKFFALLVDEKLIDEPFFNESTEQRLKLTGHSFGLIARGKPKLVRFYESKYASASKRGRLFLLEALWVAGDDETKRKLDQWERDATDRELANWIDFTLIQLEMRGRPMARDRTPPFTATDLDVPWETRGWSMPRDRLPLTATDLDLLWCDFLITGEYVPVSHILGVLELPDLLRQRINEELEKNPQRRNELFDVLQEVKLAKGNPPALIEGDLDLELNSILMDPLRRPDKKAVQDLYRAFRLTTELWVGHIALKGAVSRSVQSMLVQHPRLAEHLTAYDWWRGAKTQALVKSWLAKK
jgi:hypothetical protein